MRGFKTQEVQKMTHTTDISHGMKKQNKTKNTLSPWNTTLSHIHAATDLVRIDEHHAGEETSPYFR